MKRDTLLLFFALLFIFAYPGFAAVCPDNVPGTTIFYANGVNTDSGEVRWSQLKLEDEFRRFVASSPIDSECLRFELAENQTQGILFDLYESSLQLGIDPSTFWRILSGIISTPDPFTQIFLQRISQIDPVSFVLHDTDLQTHLQKYRARNSAGDKVVVVAHSQGNFYANEAYDELFFGSVPLATNSFDIVAVATPASFVAGDIPPYVYTTLVGDIITSVPGALSANTPFDGLDVFCILPTFRCHSFRKSYLEGARSRPKILQNIVDVISGLEFPPLLVGRYSVTDLGDLPGGADGSDALALNENGEVVGIGRGVTDSDYSDSSIRPFLWTPSEGMQQIGVSPQPMAFSGSAHGINDNGQVVGCLTYSVDGTIRRPFLWDAGSGMQLIDHPASGCAAAINASGQVVGTLANSAFRWTAAGGFDFLNIPAGLTSRAHAINSLGEVAGDIALGQREIVFWNAAGEIQRLDDLSSGIDVAAAGINDNGDIVGWVSSEGFFWSPVSGVQNLGEFKPSDINNRGQVVGTSNGRAFLWTAEEGTRDLNTLLDESGVGWTLTSANAVNNVGQIVGQGTHNGVPRAFLLTPVRVVPRPTFEGLGVCFHPTAISADGSVIVGGDCASPTRAVRWTRGEGLVPLEELLGATGSFATDVSVDGSVIVGSVTHPYFEAFRWTGGDGMLGLGDLPGGQDNSGASGVSSDGSVVVGVAHSGIVEAFRWTEASSMVGLGTLGFFPASQAHGISADGTVVVGQSSGAVSTPEAFRWTASEGMVGLGDLPGDPSGWSSATAASANGFVVVGQSLVGLNWEAFRWTQASGMVGLGSLPDGGSGFAHDVSADGSVIVGQVHFCCPGTEEAFIWDATHGMRSLKAVLENEFGLDLTGWSLFQFSDIAISDDGRTITGSGRNPSGQEEAWIVRNFDAGVP